MYVRVVSFSGFSADARDTWTQTINETVIPTLRGQKGYAGYMGLVGKDDQEFKGLVFFDSEENAEEAERAVQTRRREVSGGVGLTVESADLYEVIAKDMESART